MVRALIALSNRLVAGLPVANWFDQTLIPDGIGFDDWLVRYREHNEGKLPAIDCAGAGPACVSSRGQASRRDGTQGHRSQAQRGRGRGGRATILKSPSAIESSLSLSSKHCSRREISTFQPSHFIFNLTLLPVKSKIRFIFLY